MPPAEALKWYVTSAVPPRSLILAVVGAPTTPERSALNLSSRLEAVAVGVRVEVPEGDGQTSADAELDARTLSRSRACGEEGSDDQAARRSRSA